MDAVAPPVKFCNVVERVHDNYIPEVDNSNNNVWCLGNIISTSTTRVIQFKLSDELLIKKRVTLMHVYQALAVKIGNSKIDIISKNEIRVYIPKLLYTRMIVEELLDTIIMSPRVTPRGKDKMYRGVVGARRVLNESLIIENNELVVKKFVQIEVYGNFKLMDVFCIDGVDCELTKCNDVLELQNTLGTHAARNFLTHELLRITNMSPRHVMQVVDYMTWTGRIEPVTRHGMKFFGPLKSAAFEQPGKVLVNAALACKTEHMLSPTANVVFGQELRGIGTGIIDVIPEDVDFTIAHQNSTNASSTEVDDLNYDAYAMPFLQFLSIDEPKNEIEMIMEEEDVDDSDAPFMVDDDEFIVEKEEVRMEDDECPFDF